MLFFVLCILTNYICTTRGCNIENIDTRGRGIENICTDVGNINSTIISSIYSYLKGHGLMKVSLNFCIYSVTVAIEVGPTPTKYITLFFCVKPRRLYKILTSFLRMYICPQRSILFLFLPIFLLFDIVVS